MDDSAQGPRRIARPGRVVARVLGFDVQLNPSMLVLTVLVTVVYGGYVRDELGLSPTAGYLVGFGFVGCLLVSVLLHELGHALTARRYGIGVRGITLELLGGWTEMDGDAPRPGPDALISLAGPAVSLLLGAAAGGAALLLPDRTLADQVAFQLAVSNIAVALFNVLPGLPLDGGRVLRAGVWAVTRDRDRATELAGWAGRLIAAGTAGLVLVLAAADVLTTFGAVFLLLVTATLWRGAGQHIRLGRISRRFPLIDLARLARPLLSVPSGTPLAEAQRRGASPNPIPAPPIPAPPALAPQAPAPPAPARLAPALAVADSTGRLVALVDAAAAAAVPPERRPWVTVDTVARGIDAVPVLSAALSGEQVVRAVRASPGAQYLVTSGEDVVGVLHLADLAQLLEPRRTARRPPPPAARR